MSKIKDLCGLKFGRLVVIKRKEDRIQPNKAHQACWLCKCECGKYTIVQGQNLRSGVTTSCGCYVKENVSKIRFINLIGQKFGRLLVINLKKIDDENGALWMCKCDCGNWIVVKASNLKSKNTSSCGCLQKERTSKSKFNDLCGMFFGKLLVLEFYEIKCEKSYWLCRCECGNVVVIRSACLINGNTKSCGCLAESYIAHELKKYFIKNYNAEKEYKILKNSDTNRWLPYDIYLPKENVYIEIHGEQHYKNNTYFFKNKDEFEHRKKLDNLKRKFAKKHGTYIEIDLRKIKTTDEAINYIEKIIYE